MESFGETVGIIGSVMLMVAYFMLQYSKVKGNSSLYLYLNLFGALFILFSLYFAPNRPAILMELFWVGISVYGLWKRKVKTS